LREKLLARVRLATVGAWECQEAELAAEQAALAAAPGGVGLPGFEEVDELGVDPYAGPPEGADSWLADLPGPLLDEYIAATGEPGWPDGLDPIKAGFWDRRIGGGAGFASGSVADHLPPGPVLAGLVGDTWAAGLARLTDDELIGVLRAARRLTSWAASLELAAVADLSRRRECESEATGDSQTAEHMPKEVAAALTLTARAADSLVGLADSLTGLPATMAALRGGEIDRQKAAVIADETACLAPAHREAVEQRVLPGAAGQTTGQLRAATRTAVITADPGAARKRQEKAQRDARVERWTEDAGTAALAGRDLSPASVLAADQHLSACARWLKAAGMTGSMDQLRAQLFLALLVGRPVESLLSAAPGQPGTNASAGGITPGAPADSNAPGLRASAGSNSPGLGAPAGGINLTVPLATWLGLAETPGDVAGYGPLGVADSRSLAQSMAQNAATRWCLTLTGHDGQAVAHGCARAGPGMPGGPDPPADYIAWLAGISMEWLEAADCTHQRESPAYRPPASLQHLIRVRQRTCAFPGCRRPAARCDQDHTLPYHRGGRTCECNLAPLCRAHHAAKQASGWRLEQPSPGQLTWTTPSGRTYTTRATVYPG